MKVSKKFHKIFIVLFFANILGFSQIGPCGSLERDFTTYRNINCDLMADATYHVRSMIIPFEASDQATKNIDSAAINFVWNSYSAYQGFTTNFQDNFVYKMFIKYAPNYLSYGVTADVVSLYAHYVPYLYAVEAVYYAAQLYAHSQNVVSRSYDFYLPVQANYQIVCTVRGGWDFPNNKIALFSINPNSSTVNKPIDWHDTYASDGTQVFSMLLAPGAYRLVIGLGSGSSHQFHTAGTLDSVSMVESNYRTWTMPFIAARRSYNLSSSLVAGQTSNFSVTFPGYPNGSSFYTITDGNVTFGNLRPTGLAGLDTTSMGSIRAINKALHVTEPTIQSSALISFNGIIATYSVTRGQDLDWMEWPDGWEDLDGSGCRTPPLW